MGWAVSSGHVLGAAIVERVRGGGDGVTTGELGSPGDAQLVAELAEQAAGAHRGVPGPAGPPVPEGAALAKRRRFH